MKNRLKNMIKKIIENIEDFFIKEKIYSMMVLVECLKMVLFYLCVNIFPDYVTPYITVTVVALLLSPMLYFKNKKTKIGIGLGITLLINILLVSNVIYFEYSNNFLSLFQISNAKYGKEIMNSLDSLIKIEQVFFFIDYIMYAVYYIFYALYKNKYCKKIFKIITKAKTFKEIIANIKKIFRKKTNVNKAKNISEKKENKLKNKKERQKKRGKYTKSPKGILCISLIGISGVIVSLTTPEELLKVKFWSKPTLIAQSTIFGYHYFDAISFFSKNKADYNDIDEIEEANTQINELVKKNTEVSKYIEVKNIAKDKNVILLQLEAIQNFIINKSIDGTEITPNLNKFFAENVHFTNMHAQGLGSTADSEHTVLNSLYPLENGSVYQFYAANRWYNILNEPKKSGYYTSFMHANNRGFWNRYNVYSKSVGVDVFEEKEQFEPLEELANHWLSDEKFYIKATDKLLSYKQPFLTNMVAVSSHYPFDITGIENENEKVKVNPGKYTGTLFGNYLRAANYADYAFGKFIEELKAKNLYDDTVIIVYGDHYAMNLEDPEMIDYMQSIGQPFNKIELKHNQTNVACGIKVPGISNMQIDNPVGKTDIKPTLFNMIGVEDKFSLGKDLFAKTDYTYISNYSIITSKYMYSDGIWYELETGAELDFTKLPEDEVKLLNNHVEAMKKEIAISESIIKKNLLADEAKVEQYYLNNK
ncbi:MAG: LTA synthase family protein [Clostridia bacterium]